MTRDEAPSVQPTEAGGANDKAHTGCVPEKNTCMGRGGRCLPPATWTLVADSYPRTGGSNPPRGAFYPSQRVIHWVPKCLNTREPATEARLRGDDCTDKGDRIIPFAWALLKEPTVNVLKQEKKIQVLNALIEGCSIRSIERMTGVHRDTIMRLGLEVGEKCQRVLDQKLVDLKIEAAEIDEIWGYVGKKQKRVTALDN